jgi:hypothetical protein
MNCKIVGIMKVSKISLIRAEHADSMQETLDVIILVGRCCETLTLKMEKLARGRSLKEMLVNDGRASCPFASYGIRGV